MQSYGWLPSALPSLPAKRSWLTGARTKDFDKDFKGRIEWKKASLYQKIRRKSKSFQAHRGKSAKARLQHVVWESLELEQVNPLFLRHYVVGKNVMLSRIFLQKGSWFLCTPPQRTDLLCAGRRAEVLDRAQRKIIVDLRRSVADPATHAAPGGSPGGHVEPGYFRSSARRLDRQDRRLPAAAK